MTHASNANLVQKFVRLMLFMNPKLSWLLILMYALIAVSAFPNARRKQFVPMTKLMKNGLSSTLSRQKSARAPTNSLFAEIKQKNPAAAPDFFCPCNSDNYELHKSDTENKANKLTKFENTNDE